MPFVLHIVVICLTIMCALAWGQDSNTVVNFEAWKNQQVLEAQNQMLRTSSRINQLKSGKGSAVTAKDSSLNLHNTGKMKKTADSDSVATAEKDLKRAQESLEAANGLQLDDYISIYLPTLQDQPDALNKLAEKLSKEELAEIFKMTYQKGRPSDAKRNNVSSLDGARSKGL